LLRERGGGVLFAGSQSGGTTDIHSSSETIVRHWKVIIGKCAEKESDAAAGVNFILRAKESVFSR
jgi:hypothetical protein